MTIMDAASGQLLSPPPRSTEPDVKLLDTWLGGGNSWVIL